MPQFSNILQCEGCPIEVTIVPNPNAPLEKGGGYTSVDGIKTPLAATIPPLVRSITVTKQSGAPVDISIGSSVICTMYANGSRTFGQGNEDNFDTSTFDVNQVGVGVHDVIWDFV